VRTALLAAISLFAVAIADSGTPLDLGPEFQVNTYTTGQQMTPAVAIHEDGAFVVAWGSQFLNPESSASGVFLQRFDASGLTVGAELMVNTFTPFYQYAPDVAAGGDGSFVVVWQNACYGMSSSTCAPDGSPASISGRGFDASGLALGDEQIVNSFTTGFEVIPRVAATSSGDFVVTWTSSNYGAPEPGRDIVGVFARQFDADGAPVADEFGVNVDTSGSQWVSDVAMDAAGNFVVVWQTYTYSEQTVVARRYDANGVALGGELPIGGASAPASSPSVAATADGRFVVAWEQGMESGGRDIRAHRFAADGTAEGDELQVNTHTTGSQGRPVVATDDDGNFVVAWTAYGYFNPPPDGDAGGVFAQAFAHDGAPLGSEFQVNTYTTGYQNDPDIAVNAAGEFVVAWTSASGYRYPSIPPQDGSGDGIFARRMALRACATPAECDDDNPCTVDACEGDVCLNRRQTGCCTAVFECPDDDNACTDDQCIDNTCSHVAIPDCAPCSTHEDDCVAPDACTQAYCDCVPPQCPQGTCLFEPIDGCCLTAAECDDGHSCTEDACDASNDCVSTPIAECVECADDAACTTGCQIGPETCDEGRCVSPEGCPLIEIDDTEPLGAAGALLIRVVVPSNAPGQGKPKAVATATTGAAGSGETPAKRCSAGKRIGRLRTTLDADGDSNLVLELNRRGQRCLAADVDGQMAFDVEVRVKRKTLPLATVVQSRTWRQ